MHEGVKWLKGGQWAAQELKSGMTVCETTCGFGRKCCEGHGECIMGIMGPYTKCRQVLGAVREESMVPLVGVASMNDSWKGWVVRGC